VLPRRTAPAEEKIPRAFPHLVVIGLASCLALFLLLCVSAALLTFVSVTQLRQGHPQAASLYAQAAVFPTGTLSWLTLHQIPDLEIWYTVLVAIHELPSDLTAVQTFTAQALLPSSSSPVTNADIALRLQKYTLRAQHIVQLSRHSLIAKKVLGSPEQLETLLSDINFLSQTFPRDTHRYIILLQNSDELRPTGGFMGSYAVIELHEGKIETFEIQDIYEPDGQFTGFIDPPPGVKEYLSGGNGWRLPDSNWYPDFPTAAKDISRLFTLGKQKEPEGVIALNLQVAEELLKVIGDIYLPDQKVTVTPANLAQVARADRDSFFPGSKQKTTFLSALFTQIKIKLGELSPAQYQQLAKVFIAQAHQKNLQFYSAEPQIEAVFEKYSVDGQMKVLPNSPYLFLVEANVGINKTNRGVKREVTVAMGEHEDQLHITYTNQNPPEHNGYVNYQRVYLPAEDIVQHITVGAQEIHQWDESIFVSDKNQRFKQIGFLVTVPELSEQKVTVEYLHPPLTTPFTLFLQKQSGLQPTPYTLQFRGETKTLLLEEDTPLSF
jgi:hypothetical protein